MALSKLERPPLVRDAAAFHDNDPIEAGERR
jgi:hypothetical protein